MDSTRATATETFVSSDTRGFAPPPTADKFNLPPDWSPEEVQNFLEKFGDRVQKQAPELLAEEAFKDTILLEDQESEVVEESPDDFPVSRLSRTGLTLDSTILVDGRVTTLRAIWDAGQLTALAPRFKLEGARRFPVRVVEYEVQVVDRPLFLVVTPETYKTVSTLYPQEVAAVEAPGAEANKRMQATVKPIKADILDRRTARDRPKRPLPHTT